MKIKQWWTICHLEIWILNILLLKVINKFQSSWKFPWGKFRSNWLRRKKKIIFFPKQATPHYLTQFCQQFISKFWILWILGAILDFFSLSPYVQKPVNQSYGFFSHAAFWHFSLSPLVLFLFLPFYFKLSCVFKSIYSYRIL